MLTYKIRRDRNNNAIHPESGGTLSIGVGLDADTSTALNTEMLSAEKFFDRIKSGVIPPVTDMEKIVVYPAVYLGDDESGDPKLVLADEIEFNLHFRRRWYTPNERTMERFITDGWKTNDMYGWTTGETGDMEGKNKDGSDFDPTNYDERADLLGYMGFTDDDVFYQKSRVKKSFLRLLFFDSNSVLSKSLLTYSTVFLDSGKLFSKYTLIRNNKRLSAYLNDTDARDNEMVMFEPGLQFTGDTPDKRREELLENAKYDNLRLSAKLTLRDKFNDDASSDGFYIYLFRADAPSEIPGDLYLKAEFNNAKYGKTQNLMIPVGEDGVPVRFAEEDVVTESGTTYGFPKDFIVEDEEGNKAFNFDRYYNSLFIKVCYKYEKSLGKYVYYFPWDPAVQEAKMEETGKEYTVSNDYEARKITLNFFEPRLNRAYNIKTDGNS